ncbi:MAG: InlB B-repeat-containing protein [Firmicutes bacterium]|nr:InlB B-repeat-containing protein [Bacillota bacterium]
MLSKAKKFFSNPIYLLASVASVAILTVGAVLAFNALAANDDGTLDSGHNYKPYNIDYFYFYLYGEDANVYAQTYYQEIEDVQEQWTVDNWSAGSSGPYVYFKKVDASEDDPSFSSGDVDGSNLTVTATAPDSSAPGWNTKVWVYKRKYQSTYPRGYQYCCVGNTTVGALLAGKSGSLTVVDGYDYTKSNVDFASLPLDTTAADSAYVSDFSTSSEYYYAIGDTKPHTYTGQTGYSGTLTSAGYLSDMELFCAADSGIVYQADYQITKDVAWNKYPLQKSPAGDFVFATDVAVPMCTNDSAPVDRLRIDIVDASGTCLHGIDYISIGELDDSRESYAYLDVYGNCNIVSEEWPQYAGSTDFNVPIGIIVKYDYSRYTNSNGSNIQDPGNLDGTDAYVYRTDLSSASGQGGDLSGSWNMPDDSNSPSFKPEGTDSWRATEFWRMKDNFSLKYAKGESVYLNDVMKAYGLKGDEGKVLYTFNNETGYWEKEILVEPLFEGGYVSLTYHDSYWNEEKDWDDVNNQHIPGYSDRYVSTELYAYEYKDKNGNLLADPVVPTAALKAPESLSWKDSYGYSVDISDFTSYHSGEKFKAWNGQENGLGTAYAKGDTVTLNSDVDVYTQWDVITYHIVYDYHSPTGDDDDIVLKGGYYDDDWNYIGDQTITESIPKEITFSKDTSKDDPSGLNIFDSMGSYTINAYDGKNVGLAHDYRNIKLGFTEAAAASVPSGLNFQYWSLTNNSDEENYERDYVEFSDFTENTDDESRVIGDYYVTVHAIWSQPTYTLVYNENKKDSLDEVTGMPDPRRVTVKYSELSNGYGLSDAKPTYTGKDLVFDGWSLASDDSNTRRYIYYSDFKDESGNSTLTDGSEINVYAVWTEAKTVTYHANPPAGTSVTGSVPVDDRQYTSSQYATVQGNTGNLAVVGYEFKGWNTLPDGNGVAYSEGRTILMTYDVNLYAQWTPRSYKLHYDTNGKSSPVTDAPTTPVALGIADFTESGGNYTYTLAPDKTPQSSSYEFKGWGKTPTATAAEAITSLQLDDFVEVTSESGDKTYESTVYAIWEYVEYTLKYNANKRTGMGEVTYVAGKEVPDDKTLTIADFTEDSNGNYLYQPSETLTTEGFTFKGWNIDSGAAVPMESLSLDDFNASHECTVYAIWEENTYKLVYKKGDGHDSAVIPADENALPYTSIKDGKALSTQVPTDTGYTFAGWQVNDAAGKLNAGGTVDFASFNNAENTATATATWTINSHNVTYWEADGTTQIGTAQAYDYKSDVEVGKNAGTPKTFEDKTWTGEWAVFESSSTDADGQTIGGVGTTFKMPDSDVKFKAVYRTNTYTVRYTAGYDGSGQDDVLAENIAHGSTHNIQANTFTRTGYDFSGWQLVDPLDKDYPTNPAENTAITVKSNVTYKALWTVKQYTVTYQDGYSGNTANDIKFTVNYGTSHTVQPYSSFTRTGYTLTGWQLVSPTTGYSVTPNDSYSVVENVTYKALWTANKHTVKYEITIPSDITYTKPSDEQVDFGTSVNVKPNPTGYDTKKYTFSGWSSTDVTINAGSFTMPDNDVTIRGSFTENGKVTLTYNANGATAGTAPDPVTDYTEVSETIKDKGDLVKTGYTFDGWNASPDGSGTVYAVGTAHTFTQNTTIYAKWTPNEYHVRYYDINGNELTALAEAHDYGTAFTVRSNADIPNVTGKEIVGWKFKGGKTQDADGTTITGSGTYKMPAGDVEFQAEYNDLTYTVTYQVSNAPSEYTKPVTQSYKYNDTVTVAAVPNITGYNFTGWNCAQVDVSGANFTMPAENVVITGVFSEQGKVTLTYNANGGTPDSAVPASEWAYTQLTTTVKNHTGLTKTGYKFNGWNDQQNGTGNSYTIGNGYTFTVDTVLYAQWQKESFKVEYYEEDGTTLITSHTYPYRDAVNVGNGVTPTVGAGKVWNGEWTLINSAQKDADSVDIGTRNNYPMPAETVKYKAVLDIKTYTVSYVMEGDIPGDLTYTPPVAATYNHGDTVNVAAVPTGYDTSKYKFTGWDYNESGTYYAGGTSNASFTITENVVLKGVWEDITPPPPTEVTVTYTSGVTGNDITDPSLSLTRSEQVTLGNDYTVQANEGWTNYVRPGYRFVSWKVVAPSMTGYSLIDNLIARFVGPATIGQTFVGGDTVTALDENLRLEAQWEAIKYTVTYNANGATSGTVPTDGNDYSYNEIATVKDKGNLAKTGAVFVNWNTQPNGSGTSYAPNAQITMIENVTLYAIWQDEPTYYKVTYDANGATSGSVPQDNTRYLGGESVTVAEKGSLAKTDCTFKEWNTKANGTGTSYNENDVFNMPSSDVTLYAIWVDSSGNIVSPGTGENVIGITIAIVAMIASIIAGGCTAAVVLRKRRLGEEK